MGFIIKTIGMYIGCTLIAAMFCDDFKMAMLFGLFGQIATWGILTGGIGRMLEQEQPNTDLIDSWEKQRQLDLTHWAKKVD